MGDSLNERILSAWRAAARDPSVGRSGAVGSRSNLQLPEGFLFSEARDGLTMTFRSERGMGLGGRCNMQEDSAAFEAWALALYVHCLHCGGTVGLDIPEDASPDAEALYLRFHDYSRFLYRVLRFSKYPWFRPSPRLRERAEAFGAFLEKYDFTNNVPSGPAKGKRTGESCAEGRFADGNAGEGLWLRQALGAGEIHRQLPAGLFRGAVSHANRVFPGRGAAIDLWALSGGVMTVIELKAGGNQKIGALSELFFYTRYIYDLFVEQGNRLHPMAGSGGRGYQALSSAPVREVRGCLLLDAGSRHPLLTDSVLEELSRGRVSYRCLMYALEPSGEPEPLA